MKTNKLSHKNKVVEILNYNAQQDLRPQALGLWIKDIRPVAWSYVFAGECYGPIEISLNYRHKSRIVKC